MIKAVSSILLTTIIAACALTRQDAAATTVTHRFKRPVQQAAACFARNAEEHSSALVAEVRRPDARGHVEVIVRVKNGVTYATAELRSAGSGSAGTISLAVVTSRGARELVDSLVEGC